MTNYKSQKELIATIASNLEKLEQKNLTVEELETHVDLVRELHERTLVLRYKIFEEIAAKSKDEVQLDALVAEPKLEKQTSKSDKKAVEQKEVEEPIAELVVELPIIEEPAKEEIIDELPTIDFSLFDEPETNSVEEKITVSIQEETAEEISTPASPEPIIPEVAIQNKEENEVKIPAAVEPEKIEKIAEVVTQKVEAKSTNKGFDKKFESISNEMKGQLGFSKLDTLVGAFGLNERLQYINELFDGSSEKFSDAIKEFDKLPTLNEAKESCAKFASENSWDEESETVEEFIQKICRKYV